MVLAQVLASQLCVGSLNSTLASTASSVWRVDGVRGGSNGQHEFGTWKQSKTARAGAGRVAPRSRPATRLDVPGPPNCSRAGRAGSRQH